MKSFLSAWTYTAINKRKDALINRLRDARVGLPAITRIVRRFGDEFSLQNAYHHCHSDAHGRMMLRDLSMGGSNAGMAVAGDGEELSDDEDEEENNVDEIDSEKVLIHLLPHLPPSHIQIHI